MDFFESIKKCEKALYTLIWKVLQPIWLSEKNKL